MALKRYSLKHDFKAPYMRVTGNPRKPGRLCGVPYKKGDIVVGELKHANDQPAFVLVMKDGVQLPFPISALTELAEKNIGEESSSNASGSEKSVKEVLVSKNPKIQYIDSAILGALLGIGIAFLSEKKGWIAVPDKKNKIYGALIGAAVGAYLLYKYKNGKKTKKE